jgi:hypothetical protein
MFPEAEEATRLLKFTSRILEGGEAVRGSIEPWWRLRLRRPWWVQADNPAEARRGVASVMRLRKVSLNQPNPRPSPWQDKQLTNCVLDNSKGNQLKPGEIKTAAGVRYQT